jgi:ATP-binding cassette subfamily B protein
MILASIFEVISLGALIPFLGVLVNFNNSNYDLYFIKINAYLPVDSTQLLLFFTTIFCAAILLSSTIRLYLVWYSGKVAFLSGSDLGGIVFSRILSEPYSWHIKINSSEIVAAVISKINIVIYNIILPIFTILSSLIILTAVVIFLSIVNFYLIFGSFIFFSISYLSIALLTKKRLALDGVITSVNYSRLVRVVNEALGGIRDVLLDSSQKVFYREFINSDILLRASQARIQFIAICPRFILEAIGMLAIVISAYFMSANFDNGFIEMIPLLGVLVLGAQRILPLLQQIYSSWAAVKAGEESLSDILGLVHRAKEVLMTNSIEKLDFNEISLENIYFRYAESSDFVLEDINISIKKGDRIGIVGSSGSGKSTLLDIFMCLLRPVSGFIKVDGKIIDPINSEALKKNISHVPQHIYLSDSSVEENIAFGIERDLINRLKVVESARKSKISETIESWPLAYKTIIGEDGIKLSGGQRQRIGVARALYKNASLLIFDEATSALDINTELSVLKSIEGLSRELTMIIVSHRISTLANCDKIFEVKNKNIYRIK